MLSQIMEKDLQIIVEEIVQSARLSNIPYEAIDIPFIDAICPWMQVADRKLKERLDGQLSLLSDKAYLAMQMDLMERWSSLCSPSLHFEMQLQSCESFLVKNSTGLYRDFVKDRCLNSGALRLFFEEYKELGRLVAIFLLFWVDRCNEFLQRLEKDLFFLSKIFNQDQPLGKVISLQTNMGDVHFEGQAVSILSFACGKSVVYKPKNMQMSLFFHSFLEKLNSLGIEPFLKLYPILVREDYGWEEKVENTSCHDLVEVERCFQRIGMYLCLVYLLNGTDIHYENIIISGEHPILIDLETLFHADLGELQQEAAKDLLKHSVLSTCLLPILIFSKIKQRGVDIGALGQNESMHKTLWKNVNTEEMELVNEMQSISHAQNRVLLNGKSIAGYAHIEDIIKGFTYMYHFIQQHKELLDESEFSVIKSIPVRMILRNTRFYKYLLNRLSSPEAILHQHVRDQVLDLLQRSSLVNEQIPLAVIEEEKKRLLQGDIPCFHTYPASYDLFCKKNLILKNCMQGTSYEKVTMRVKQMNLSDLALQIKLITHSFYARYAEVHSSHTSAKHFLSSSMQKSSKDTSLLSHALEIAKKLKTHAIESEDGSLGWIHLIPNPYAEQYQLHPSCNTLYAGRTGIALFFAAMAKISGDSAWASLAINTLANLQKNLAMHGGKHFISNMGIGGMSGASGLAYGLYWIGKILSLPSLIKNAKELIFSIEPRHVEEDMLYDIMGGSSGLLLVLLSLYQGTSDPHLLALADLCGEHLCYHVKEQENGAVAWGSEGSYMLGFSHGTAGIAYALLKLYSYTKKEKFSQIAHKAFSYERQHFSKEKRNWPRFKSPLETLYPSSWCHGATGIGLSRLMSCPYSHDFHISEEIDIALKTTITSLYGNSFSLCCGLCGRIEFLNEAFHALQRPESDPILMQAVNALLEETEASHSTDSFFNPGFMQGLSGVGYTLLRLMDKERSLPQVLLLQ